nr:MAG TPA: hypothetical protein [Caudoviricetes sp.]DAS49622.1 MAG TPA: hypothetical protein [Caudoviricetes sp.]
MLQVTSAYKEEMKKPLRGHTLMRVNIGVINQEAQGSAKVSSETAYFSNLEKPLNNYVVDALYATAEQNYSSVDGRMYFLPREKSDCVLNQGIVSKEIKGIIDFIFPVPVDLRGVTIDFGKTYPEEFTIVTDQSFKDVTGNTKSKYVCDEVFKGTTTLSIIPNKMVNGHGRLHIHEIIMGIGIYFNERNVLSASKKEHISPIMEALPTIDFRLSVNNKDRAYDIENEKSTVNFLELGQKVQAFMGQEIEDRIEWLQVGTLKLKEWSADDDKMSFTAIDFLSSLTGKYRKGEFYPQGISIYDLCLDVLTDAGVDTREFYIDEYLKAVKIKNPIPVVSHREALQLLSNAGRCLLYQDEKGKIVIRSSFVPRMTSTVAREPYFSNGTRILENLPIKEYSLTNGNYTKVDGTTLFLPRSGKADVGYIDDNMLLNIRLEAAFACFGMQLQFGRTYPSEIVIDTSLNGKTVEELSYTVDSEDLIISHEFAPFDEMLIYEEAPSKTGGRAVLNKVSFGNVTDYELSYGRELTKTPLGTQLQSVKTLELTRTEYLDSTEGEKELAKVECTKPGEYLAEFSNPSYGCTVQATSGTVTVLEVGAHFLRFSYSGSGGEVKVNGKEYLIKTYTMEKELNPSGKREKWKNPLISDTALATDVLDWVGNYLKADREYSLSYRGEPRLMANDLLYLENKYVDKLMLRVFDHTLNYNGALSGSIKARREVSFVEDT